MVEFRAIIAETKHTPETDLLLERVRSGSKVERDAALDALRQNAIAINSPDSWNTVGVGFHLAGLNDDAVRIFDALVSEAPDQDTYRLNLATCYSQTQQVGLCRHHLLHLAEHGTTTEMRQLGREQLDGYDRFLGNTEQDRKLRDLQIRSLRAAIARPEKKAEEFVTLARLLIRRGMLDPEDKSLDDAIGVLQQGHSAFPKAVEILELLVPTYLRHDPDQHLQETLKQLEKIAPDSQVLRLISGQDEEEARHFSENTMNRANDLMKDIFDGDSGIREAALRDLAGIVAQYPDNPHYRANYAFGLMSAGSYAAALEQATIAAQSEVYTHSFHFNLGQVFWGCGEVAEGRRHLQLAFDYAANEQERLDVVDRIKDLESR